MRPREPVAGTRAPQQRPAKEKHTEMKCTVQQYKLWLLVLMSCVGKSHHARRAHHRHNQQPEQAGSEGQGSMSATDAHAPSSPTTARRPADSACRTCNLHACCPVCVSRPYGSTHAHQKPLGQRTARCPAPGQADALGPAPGSRGHAAAITCCNWVTTRTRHPTPRYMYFISTGHVNQGHAVFPQSWLVSNVFRPCCDHPVFPQSGVGAPVHTVAHDPLPRHARTNQQVQN